MFDYQVFTAAEEPHTKARHIASTLHVEEAAVLISFLGEGATIRLAGNGKIVYTEGIDGKAGESYDEVVEIVFNRA